MELQLEPGILYENSMDFHDYKMLVSYHHQERGCLMPRYTRLVALASTGLIYLYEVGSTFASGGPVVPFYKEVFAHSPIWEVLAAYSKLLAVIFCATVAVEYLTVYFLLGGPSKVRIKLLFYIVLINMVTNPAAQFLMLFVGDPDLVGSAELALVVTCVIEFVVVTVEYGLLRWVFGRMHRRGLLYRPVTATRTFVISLVANAASFAIGVVGSISIIPLLYK
ncbi:MAG: hypothetical protein ACOYXY_10685 [Thermodesulfobacteriota bacterium]